MSLKGKIFRSFKVPLRTISKGYWPGTRGYTCDIFPSWRVQGRSPRARHEGNISHIPEGQVNNMPIFSVGEVS